jgi:hypothetical protein
MFFIDEHWNAPPFLLILPFSIWPARTDSSSLTVRRSQSFGFGSPGGDGVFALEAGAAMDRLLAAKVAVAALTERDRRTRFIRTILEITESSRAFQADDEGSICMVAIHHRQARLKRHCAHPRPAFKDWALALYECQPRKDNDASAQLQAVADEWLRPTFSKWRVG